MRLLTLNCHSWQEENQLKKIQHVAETIAANDYDVVALQEVSQKETSEIVEGVIRKDNYGLLLQQELKKHGKDYSLMWDQAHKTFDIYEEGLATLTKHPVKKVQTHFVSSSRDYNNWKTRIVLQTDIEIKCNIYSFFNCHFGWWADEQEPGSLQLQQLMDIIPKDVSVFLMGDFNSEADIEGEGYSYMLANGFYDTYVEASDKDQGITVPGKIAGWDDHAEEKRIDYIFTNKKVPVAHSKVIFNGENKDVVSDHYGVDVKIAKEEL